LRQLLRFSRRVKQSIRRYGEIRFSRKLYQRQHCKHTKHTNRSLRRPRSNHLFWEKKIFL
jgi:hypothetical protein